MYHFLESTLAAQLAFDLGFKDIDCLNTGGLTPLALAISEWMFEHAYFSWQVENGASLTHKFAYIDIYNQEPIDELFLSHTIAHRLTMEFYNFTDNALVLLLLKILEQVTTKDGCNCCCAGIESGCSPLLIYLNRYLKESFRPTSRLEDILKAIQEAFEHDSRMTALISKPLIRLLAFRALGFRHTCCLEFDLDGNMVNTSSSDDFDEIREEDAPLLERLEPLVADLIAQFEECDVSIFTFLDKVGLQRIHDVVDDMNQANLTQDAKDGIEEIGVRLICGPVLEMFQKPINGEGRHHIDRSSSPTFWFEEFEKIVQGDLSRPRFYG